VITGVLRITDVEGGAVYLETADGKRYEPRWPAGWRVDLATGALAGPDGQAGNRITVRGEVASDLASLRQVGAILVVSEILALEWRWTPGQAGGDRA
jgi:hypothetical protein